MLRLLAAGVLLVVGFDFDGRRVARGIELISQKAAL